MWINVWQGIPEESAPERLVTPMFPTEPIPHEAEIIASIYADWESEMDKPLCPEAAARQCRLREERKRWEAWGAAEKAKQAEQRVNINEILEPEKHELQTSVSKLGKRSLELTLESDEPESERLAKRCRGEEMGENKEHCAGEQHLAETRLGKRSRDTTADENVLDYESLHKKHCPTDTKDNAEDHIFHDHKGKTPLQRQTASLETKATSQKLEDHHHRKLLEKGIEDAFISSEGTVSSAVQQESIPQAQAPGKSESDTEPDKAPVVRQQSCNAAPMKKRGHEALAGSQTAGDSAPCPKRQRVMETNSAQASTCIPEQDINNESAGTQLRPSTAIEGVKSPETATDVKAGDNPNEPAPVLGSALASSTTTFRDRRPVTREDRVNIRNALMWTLHDIIARYPDILNDQWWWTRDFEDATLDPHDDFSSQSFGVQYNNLQSIFEERRLYNYTKERLDKGLTNPMMEKNKKHRKSRAQKKFEAKMEYLVEVEGSWLTGFDDWKPPGTGHEQKQKEEKGHNMAKEKARKKGKGEALKNAKEQSRRKVKDELEKLDSTTEVIEL